MYTGIIYALYKYCNDLKPDVTVKLAKRMNVPGFCAKCKAPILQWHRRIRQSCADCTTPVRWIKLLCKRTAKTHDCITEVHFLHANHSCVYIHTCISIRYSTVDDPRVWFDVAIFDWSLPLILLHDHTAFADTPGQQLQIERSDTWWRQPWDYWVQTPRHRVNISMLTDLNKTIQQRQSSRHDLMSV